MVSLVVSILGFAVGISGAGLAVLPATALLGKTMFFVGCGMVALSQVLKLVLRGKHGPGSSEH